MGTPKMGPKNGLGPGGGGGMKNREKGGTLLKSLAAKTLLIDKAGP